MPDKDVSKFLRASKQRLTSAEVLYKNGVYLDCVYLAGYSIECALKSAILSQVPLRNHREFIQEHFRGAIAHDYEYLKKLLKDRGFSIPADVTEMFCRVSSWSTDLRYEVGLRNPEETESFLNAAAKILKWVEGSVY
jgi:HEPN domain-containing protein